MEIAKHKHASKGLIIWVKQHIVIALLLTFVIPAVIRGQTIPVQVDLNQKYQTIENFAASDCWWAQAIGNKWSIASKDSVADLLFSRTKGIGLSGWRFNLGGGPDPTISNPLTNAPSFEVAPGKYDWSRDAGGQWFLKAAKARGVKQFIAFVNSPPRNMTRNGHTYCTSGLGSTNLKNGCYDEYAKYLADILEHFRDSLGIDFNYVSPVNEPQWEWNGNNQEGNRASDDDIRKIVDSLYAELQAQKVSTKILIPESGSLPGWYEDQSSTTTHYGQTYGDFLDSLFGVPDVASKAAKILAGHSYWSDLLNGQLVQRRQTLGSKLAPYFNKGYEYWMTEYCIMKSAGPYGDGIPTGQALTMTPAIYVTRLMYFDLTLCDASAWQWWTALNAPGGLISSNLTAQTISQSKTLWALGNFSRFIRPGSKRVSCTGADNKVGLMASAYVDSAANKLIVVLINAATTNQKINLSISGLGSGQTVRYFTPFVTSNSRGDNLRKYPYLTADSIYDVPAYSVVTLVGDLDGDVYTAGTPGSAVLQYPISGDTLGPADSVLVWHSAPEATSYEVQISPDSLFSFLQVDTSSITDTLVNLQSYIDRPISYPPNPYLPPPNALKLNTEYYWRVIAKNDSGTGSYSQTWNFETPGQITAVRGRAGDIPNRFSLGQNYPNPFNPSTTIRYAVSREEHIVLSVYNMLGERVATLVNRRERPGEYSVEFDASSLASGVYIYSINAGGFNSSREMILLK